MAKRFTCTDKYKKPFIRGLQGAYKLLWDYLYHDCNHAGIWIVDFEVAQIYIGNDMPICKEKALEVFKEKVHPFDNGSKWFIPSFIIFQYGELNENNRAHKSVIDILLKYNLLDNKGHIRPLQGCKDMVKDKDLKAPFILPDWIDQNLWKEFLKVQKKKKTDFAKQLAVDTLEKFRESGGDIEVIMKHTIEGGWSRFYEPVDKKGPDNPGISPEQRLANASKKMGLDI